MPAGPVGSCWVDNSWPDTAWEAGSWAGLTETLFQQNAATLITISTPTAIITFGFTCVGQDSYPESDLASGGWAPSEGTDLYAMIDEPQLNVETYIRSADYAIANTAKFTLSDITTPQAGTTKIFVWARKVV